MPCAHCQGADQMFSTRSAEREARRLRKRGADAPTQALIDEFERRDVAGASVIDVGAGIGAVHLALLEAGAGSAVDVDASHGYLAVARDEAERRGFADKVEHRFGDAVELGPTLADADIVVLNRVLCCYPDMPALVEATAPHARRMYGVVIPRDRRLVRAGLVLFNAMMWVRRSAFRVFAHSHNEIDRNLRAHGLEATTNRPLGVFWHLTVWERR